MPLEEGFGHRDWPVETHHARFLHIDWLSKLFGARLAALPNRPNPSSVDLLRPYSRTSLGRQMGFGRHFTVRSSAPGSLSTEFGWNSNFFVAQAGGPGLRLVDMGIHDFPTGADIARHVEVTLNDHLEVGTAGSDFPGTVWRCVYDLDTLSFTISSTTAFSLYRYTIANGGTHDNAGLETLGFLEADTTSGAFTYTGNPTCGTEEWIVWDVGYAGLLGRESTRTQGGEGHCADWLAIRDLNLDLVPPAAGPGLTTTDDFDVAHGYSKAVLYGSNDMEVLEQWTEQTWEDGVDRFVLVDESKTGADNPITKHCLINQLYGTDGRSWIQRQSDPDWAAGLGRTGVGGVFPARTIAANLRAWSLFYSQDGPPYVGPWTRADGRPSFRYWMLVVSNPGNSSGRLTIGPHSLAAGMYFRHNMVDGSGFGSVDRGSLEASEFGVMTGRPGQPGREFEAKLEYAVEADVDLFDQTCLRLRENDSRAGAPHQVAFSGRRGGRHRPFFMVDPLWRPVDDQAFEIVIPDGATLGLCWPPGDILFPPVFIDVGGISGTDPVLIAAAIQTRLRNANSGYFDDPGPLQFTWRPTTQTFRLVRNTTGVQIILTGDPGTAWPLLGFTQDHLDAPGIDFGVTWDADTVPAAMSARSTKWARGTIFGSPELDPAGHKFLNYYSARLRIREWGEGR